MSSRKKISKKQRKKNLHKKLLIFAIGIAIAALVVTSESFQNLLQQITPLTFLAEFVAGVLYTSFLTIPISLSMFSVLIEEGNLYFIALVGAIGAATGDYVIMNLFNQAEEAVGYKSERIERWRKKRLTRYGLTLLGLLCLAFPVPDEIAMSMLGVARIKLKHFILLVYPTKVLGIASVLLSIQAF